jgi:hypothetical protein
MNALEMAKQSRRGTSLTGPIAVVKDGARMPGSGHSADVPLPIRVRQHHRGRIFARLAELLREAEFRAHTCPASNARARVSSALLPLRGASGSGT